MMKKGLTLIELMIVIVLFVILTAVGGYMLRAVLLSWSSQETRTGVEINIDTGMEWMVRDIREATEVQSVNDEIRFTRNGVTYYVYYLYNASDSYPPAFNQSIYQVKKATLTGAIDGTFTYGSGQLIMTDVFPPPTSDLSEDDNVVTIDISINRKNETVRSRTDVKLRNI